MQYTVFPSEALRHRVRQTKLFWRGKRQITRRSGAGWRQAWVAAIPQWTTTPRTSTYISSKGVRLVYAYIFSFLPCSGNDAGNWDPMASDYNSTDFNAYNSGVGALMQAGRSLDGEGGGDITLFVSNIPTTLTKVSVINFSGFAAVTLTLLSPLRMDSVGSSLELVQSRGHTSSSLPRQTNKPPMGKSVCRGSCLSISTLIVPHLVVSCFCVEC